MKNTLLVSIIIIAFSISINSQSNDWLIKFEKPNDISTLKLKSKKIESVELISKSMNVYNIITSEPIDKSAVYKSYPNALSVCPNLTVEKRNIVPDDFLFEEQYSMKLIQADRVWEETVGGQDFYGNDIVIAVLDDGFDALHSDLVENYWINPSEIPNDGIDNDDNGYIDDTKGVNIQAGSGVHFSDKHGTQVAGIIGAKGDNGMGIAGVNWNSKILLVSGVSNIGQIIKGLEYLYDLKKKYIDTDGREGANIVVNNFSGGLRNRFPEDFPIWCDQYELLGSVGILSVGAVANANFDVETDGDLPTLCESDHLIMVTNTNEADKKVVETATGIVSVDLGAPGERIVSADLGSDYSMISGTSASAPHVAGAIGLLYSIPCESISNASQENPSQFALTIKDALLDGVDPIISLEQTVSGGRLNIFNSLFNLNGLCGTATSGVLSIEGVRPNLFGIGAAPSELVVTYTTDTFGEHTVYIHSSTGQLISQDQINPNIFGSREIRIDTDQFVDTGLYIISLESQDKIVSKTFVIN